MIKKENRKIENWEDRKTKRQKADDKREDRNQIPEWAEINKFRER